MTAVIIYLAAVFAAGLVAVVLRLPPLIGFLAAGFILSGYGVDKIAGLEVAADIGVTLMLFAIGLKLDLKALLGKEVWLTATAHMVLAVLAGTGFIALLSVWGIAGVANMKVAAVLAFALSFSSTVFAIKILQDRGDEQALYGRITIGVLVMQDIFAVIFISISAGTLPHPLTFALAVLIPVLVVILRRFTRLGHGEMQALFGIFMALVPGFALFEYLGLSGSLGALIMGLVLAGHPGADQLSNSLFTLKELLLVAFFVNIGYAGTLTTTTTVGGLALLALLPIQWAAYWGLLALLGMRHRTSLLTAALLANYSEFGLIVAALGVSAGWLDSQWLMMIAVAVAASFVVAALINPRNTSVLSTIAARIPPRPPEKLNIHDRPIHIGQARALVLGMGRVGSAAYQQLVLEHGFEVLGVEHDPRRVELLRSQGVSIVEGDATDTDFWDRVIRNGLIEIIILAMPEHHANMDALREIRHRKFTGTVAAVAMYFEDVRDLHDLGIDVVVHMFAGAGRDLADQGVEVRRLPRRNDQR